MKTGLIDLHLHSTCSDGTSTPEEVVERAAEVGLFAISLTDHDSIDGLSEARAAGSRRGVEVVPGVELSAQADGKDIHLLGYFVDATHPDLLACLHLCRRARTQRAERMVHKLNKMGIPVRIERVLDRAGGGAVGRPHVADVLVEEGHVFSANEAFRKYLGYSRPAYESKYSLSPAEALAIIHAADGLGCLAHPGLYGRDDLIPGLVDQGMDGIEVRHTKHSVTDVARYTEVANHYGLLMSGGSDCHGDGRGDPVMGAVKVPRDYVEALREAHQERLGP